eukprot:747414-Hanusia_phi.AAC.1
MAGDWPSECGMSDGEDLIDRSLRVYHTEDYAETTIRVDYDYWEVNASVAKTFWGLQGFSLLLPCASSTSADCSMTTPLTRTCADVTGGGGTCVQSGQYLYLYYSNYYMTWWAAETFCSQNGRGGHLAYFADGQTYDHVTSALGADNFWIGLRSEAGPVYDLRWTAGGSPTFSRWQYGPPFGGGQYETVTYVQNTYWYSSPYSTDTMTVLCSYPK